MNSEDVAQDRKFKIAELIGEGSCGKVFVLEDAKGGTCAYKAADSSRADLVFLLRTELARMNTIPQLHSNVVLPVLPYTVKIEQDVQGIVLEGILMPRQAGGTLDEALEGMRIVGYGDCVPFSLRYSLLCDISAGLDHVHVNGLVHCDVKADNVLLDGRLRKGVRAAITDFGMACTEGTAVKKLWGCETHCAPELCGTATTTGAHSNSDSYSLGILMAYMVLDDAINPFLSIDQGSDIPILEQKACALEEALEILEEEMPDDKLWVDIIRKLTAFYPDDRMSMCEVHQIACSLVRAVEETESDEDSSTVSGDWQPGTDVFDCKETQRKSELDNDIDRVDSTLGLSDWPFHNDSWETEGPDSTPLLMLESTTTGSCCMNGQGHAESCNEYSHSSLLLNELLSNRRLSTESNQRYLSRQISARASGCGTNSRRASVCKSYSKGKRSPSESKGPGMVKSREKIPQVQVPPARWVAGRRRNQRPRKGHWCKNKRYNV